jgi:hypothetical protein
LQKRSPSVARVRGHSKFANHRVEEETMTVSINNALARGSLVIGALALIGMMGCATEEGIDSEDPTAEEVAQVSSEVSTSELCYSPYVNEYNEWKFYGESPWVDSWKWYSTYNTYVGKYLKYGHRDYGLDLFFHEVGQYIFKYERQGGGDVYYGDYVAIRVGNWGYLYYAPQPYGYGFDLKFSNYPRYEWVIGGGYGKVATGTKVSLHNLYRHDYMVWCKRSYGINLSWAGECHYDAYYGYGRFHHNSYCAY